MLPDRLNLTNASLMNMGYLFSKSVSRIFRGKRINHIRSLSKAGVWVMFVAGAASLILSLQTVHIQKKSSGSRLAEAAVGLAHMRPDKIDNNYIRKIKRKNGREY